MATVSAIMGRREQSASNVTAVVYANIRSPDHDAKFAGVGIFANTENANQDVFNAVEVKFASIQNERTNVLNARMHAAAPHRLQVISRI